MNIDRLLDQLISWWALVVMPGLLAWDSADRQQPEIAIIWIALAVLGVTALVVRRHRNRKANDR
ncbi:hypothetical protein [Nonomuraea basaltis]|uniref:hypothetical protein n=1 Tax=Nonomuraea basaltis TaxID=2495887 RepID=UPI00110C6B14|nr:hypothetical protein [Nonomuraea basaltis]TMR91284.1 hypothetical protein EJK15_50730 [Nonomuraea basaltis]